MLIFNKKKIILDLLKALSDENFSFLSININNRFLMTPSENYLTIKK